MSERWTIPICTTCRRPTLPTVLSGWCHCYGKTEYVETDVVQASDYQALQAKVERLETALENGGRCPECRGRSML